MLLAAGQVAAAAVLQGVVVENRTGKPVARVRVTVEVVEGNATAEVSTLTGASGHFQFSVGAGSYHLSAQKKGYVTARYGQKRHSLPGTPIRLGGDDQHSVELRLARPGAVTGEITDENGIGMPECQVYAFRAESRLRLVASGETDDQGRYRISGLEPGQYLIGTAARLLEDGRHLLPTFFGQSVAAVGARTVEVRLDEEFTAANIEPLPGRLSTLTGILKGGGASHISLLTEFGRAETQVGPGGSFQFGGLIPGTYELLVEGGTAEHLLSAWRKVTLAKELETVEIELAASPVLRLACREREDKRIEPRLISIFYKRAERPEDSPQRLDCGQSVTLTPGEWSFTTLLPGNLYVVDAAGARLGESGFQLTLSPRQNRELELILSSRPGSVAGRVTTGAGEAAIGAPVHLRPLDAALAARMGPSRFAEADQEGNYRVDGLAPGRYEVVSSFGLRLGDLARWRGGVGRQVTVREGEQERLDLELSEIEAGW